VNEKWSHDRNSTLRDNTIDWHRMGRDFVNPVIAQHAQRVRSWQYPQRTVLNRRIVQAHAQRHDLAQSDCRRVRVVNSFLHRPRAPAIHFDA
jgi:hypothetical protein